ncbi:MAG: hypothetical protein LUC90_05745, partial [Lachnospiraceae bacterium]|nr:hypothetical protein [Lachnospiraceae bacterium]
SAEITYEIYAMMNIDDSNEENLTAGDSYEHWFKTKYGDEFFTVSGSTASYAEDLTYNGTTTDSALKMDGSGSVSFEATAVNGTLTLVYSTNNRKNSSTYTNYGPDFSITDSNGKVYSYVINEGTVTVYKNTEPVNDDPYNVVCETYDTANNVVVITLTLKNAGKYTIARSKTASSQCCLYYIKYAYQYRYLTDGVLTKTDTLTASSTITEMDDEGNVTDTTNWAKLYEGLPLYIYADDGRTVIGNYSYYVKETGVTMTINGADQTFIYDSASGKYTYTYSDDTNTTYIYSVSPTLSLAGTNTNDTISAAAGTIAGGTLALTNTVSYSSETTYYLPESGGTGTRRIYALAVLLIGLSGGLAIARKGRRQAG